MGSLRPQAWGRVHMMRSGKRSWNPVLSPEDLGEEDLDDFDDILVSDYPEPQQYQVSKRADISKEGNHLIFCSSEFSLDLLNEKTPQGKVHLIFHRGWGLLESKVFFRGKSNDFRSWQSGWQKFLRQLRSNAGVGRGGRRSWFGGVHMLRQGSRAPIYYWKSTRLQQSFE